MRLATFNLLNGTSLADGQVNAGRLRAAVRTLRADVVGVQEVDRGQDRSHGLDLTAEVAAAAGAEHWRFVPAIVGTPGAAWRAATDADHGHHDGPGDRPGTATATDADQDEPGDRPVTDADHGRSGDQGVQPRAATPTRAADLAPHYGVGLVSRWPVRAWHVVRLPAAPVRSPVFVPGTRQLIWVRDEPRVGLAAVVETPVGPVTVATTHLSFVPGWNAMQLRRLVTALAALPGPRVLLGDLNMPGQLPRWLTQWTPLARTLTYPAWQPRLQLDHVLGSGRLPPVVGVEALQLPVSDHRALVVELSRRPFPD